MVLVAPYAKIVLVQYIVKREACVLCLGINANVEMVSTDQDVIKGITFLTFPQFDISIAFLRMRYKTNILQGK